MPFDELIFARQKLLRLADLRGLDPKDRITPILAALEAPCRTAGRRPIGDLWVEHPDSDDAKPLAGLARSFGNALRPALRKAGWLTRIDDPRRPRLHVVFLAGDHAMLAQGEPARRFAVAARHPAPAHARRCAQPLGAETGRSPADPGRTSTSARACSATGMRGADLGAAPGGWTWVLMRQGLRVIAIDNGPLRQHLLDSGRVEHLRADGFQWQPKGPLDWMVCDMVEQPRRVAERMATWFREGWCRHAIFNLKLPMKKRWDETRLCLELFERQAREAAGDPCTPALPRPRGNHRLRHAAMTPPSPA